MVDHRDVNGGRDLGTATTPLLLISEPLTLPVMLTPTNLPSSLPVPTHTHQDSNNRSTPQTNAHSKRRDNSRPNQHG